MTNHLSNSKILNKAIICISLLFLSNPVFAEAGRVVFTYGNVSAVGSNGIVRKLYKRSHVIAGETIKTSSNSLVQLRMIDKAFIALRSNSEFKIEAYKLGATKEQDTGIFSLLKGGFRAVTGIIGKRLRSAYKLRTLTATIGIRGTDYTARLCNQDCNQAFGNLSGAGSIEDGLYVGVNEGGIDLTNDLGTLGLDELQFGYVKDATTAPVALISAPEFLYFNSRAPNPDADQADNSENEVVAETSVVASRAEVEPVSADLNTDDSIKEELKLDNVELAQDQIEQNKVIDQVVETTSGTAFSLTDGNISSSRMIVSSLGEQGTLNSLSSVHSNPFSSANITDNELTQFENENIDSAVGVGQYSQGTTSTIDLGFDPVTGISWGRWGGGTAQFQTANGNIISQNLTTSSLHWIASPDQAQSIALPSTGSASYNWVGNTSPTDNLGNTGILGNATLDANFTNMTVDTSVSIGINNQVWNGSGSGLAISSDGGFSGDLSTVDINTANGSFSGSGMAAGFITDNANGAGLGFSLEADIGGTPTSVSGSAIFQKN